MALVSWFPLNGDICDRINGDVFSNASSATFIENDMFGKSLGGNSVQFTFPAATTNEIFNSDYCSIAFWIYVTGTEGASIIFGNNDMSANSSTNRKYSLYQYPSCNDLHLSWQNYDGSMYTLFVLNGALPTKTWTHVCLTYNGTKGVYLYINGEIKWSTSKTSPQSESNWNVNMNAIYQSQQKYLNDFRIYNHCLSVKEVKELARGLFLKYSFDDIQTSDLSIGKDFSTNSATSVSYDAENAMYTIISNYGSSVSDAWGSGPALNNFSCPYGYTYRVSMDVYVLTTHSLQVDTNNSTPGVSAWSGNDNDNTSLRYYSLNINAGKWTHIFWCGTNTHSSNSSQVLLSVYDTIGLKTYNDTSATTWYIKNFKFELSKYSYSDGFIPISKDSIIYDNSGFGNDGKCNDIIYKSDIRGTHWENNFPSYIVNTAFPAKQIFTFNAWINPSTPIAAYGFIMGNGRDYGNGCGASLFVNANCVPYFRIGNGSTVISIGGNNSLSGGWHMISGTYDGSTGKLFVDGILLSSSALAGPLSWSDVDVGHPFVIGKMAYSYNNSSVYFPFNGDIDDVRVYNTALSEDDIYNLYSVKKSISSSGELFVNNVDENIQNNLSITKNGKQQAKVFSELVTLNDGSTWLQLMHHDMLGKTDYSNNFTNSDAVRNSNCFIDENRWACFPLMKICDHGSSYEFMVLQQKKNGDVITRYRWSQAVSPYDATFSTTTHANITAIENIPASYGGMYPGGSNNSWFFNNSVDGNWFGCGFVSGEYDEGQIPGYAGASVKGIQDVFIRVYSNNFSERNGGIVSTTEIKCI